MGHEGKLDGARGTQKRRSSAAVVRRLLSFAIPSQKWQLASFPKQPLTKVELSIRYLLTVL